MRATRAPQAAALLGSYGGRAANSQIPNSPRRHILRAVSRLLAARLLALWSAEKRRAWGQRTQCAFNI